MELDWLQALPLLLLLLLTLAAHTHPALAARACNLAALDVHTTASSSTIMIFTMTVSESSRKTKENPRACMATARDVALNVCCVSV